MLFLGMLPGGHQWYFEINMLNMWLIIFFCVNVVRGETKPTNSMNFRISFAMRIGMCLEPDGHPLKKTWFQGEGSVQNPPGSHEPWVILVGSWRDPYFITYFSYRCPSFLRWVGQISSSKKKTATCHLGFLLFFTLLDGEFGFPLTIRRTSWTPFQLLTMSVPVRWSQWLGIHKAPEAFGIYRDLFRRNIARILQYFLWNFLHVTSWKHLYWIWIWSLNLKNHKILKLLVKLDSKILIWC